ncbi:hypothetical protein [Pantoea cypripedii]|uniref:Uncharacterized protein n=1 Tax=Pantoea cypripedii TaxID=55209 RepID=A0A6B9G312_PANCY|nr:hypothetical protein [Pantoea cypripedii]QGY29160.1 hypothetical protein CUN67_09555 [Pantoea cypripedii]
MLVHQLRMQARVVNVEEFNMHGATPVFAPATGRAVPESAPLSTFPLSRFCRSLRNSLAHLYSNHRLPRSPSEALRQSLSNADSYLSILTRSSPAGIETPPLAAAQLVTRWIFSLLQQHAIHQADSRRLQLLTVTSAYPAVNAFIYRLNTLALSATTPQQATCALRRIEAFTACQHAWLASLPPQEQQVCCEFMHKLTACLENMAFWQPRATLLLPAVCRLAPYFSVWAGVTLPQLALSASPPPACQRLSASILTEDNTGPDAEQWFTPDRTVINLPGDMTLPTLHLSKGQSRCLRLPKCPAELVSHTGNLTTGFDIAGVGIEHNLATEVCISNYGVPEIEINRQLNAATTAYPSRLYRVPLRIAGAGDDGVCPASRAAIPVTFSHQPDLLPAPALAGEPLRAASAGWNLLPMVGAQYSAGDANGAREQNPFLPPFFDWQDFYLPDEVEETSPPAETLSASLSPAEQIDHEVNLFERNKRMFIPFLFPMTSRPKTGFPATSTLPSAVTQNIMHQLFGATDEGKPVGSCRIKHEPLIARDLDEMLAKAQRWLRQIPATQIDYLIHSFYRLSNDISDSPSSALAETVSIAITLVSGSDHQYDFDHDAAYRFASFLFRDSPFIGNQELLEAWISSSEGKQQLSYILLGRLDRTLPGQGNLLSTAFSSLFRIMRPEHTLFSSLANIQLDLKNGLKNNIRTSVISTAGSLPHFLKSEVNMEKLQFLFLEFIKYHLPFFRLSAKQDVSNELIFSASGVLLTVAAGLIEDENKLSNLTNKKLKQFGMHALLNYSEDYLLRKFSHFDRLLKKGQLTMMDYLNGLVTKGGLLARSLYLNNNIALKLLQGGEPARNLKTEYMSLSDIEKKIYILALGQVPQSDQAFFLRASRSSAGIEVCFITSENSTESVKHRHFIGMTIAADFENNKRCYFISEIPALNNFAADLIYDDSQHYAAKEQYTHWINQQGKAAFVSRLSPQSSLQSSQTTFFTHDIKPILPADLTDNWQTYIHQLSQHIVNRRFPEIHAATTVSPPVNAVNTMINFTGNLVTQFIPIQSCKHAIDDILDIPNTAKKTLLTLEDAAICLYDLSPQGEGSKVVKSLSFVARSVVGKIVEDIRTVIKPTSPAANQNPIDVPQLEEQMYMEDSQVKHYLANAPLFNADFGWMIHNNSLDILQLSSQVKITDVRWNTITDQIYCKANTTQGFKNYRFDQRNFLLLPTSHLLPDNQMNNQELALNTHDFLSCIRNDTLDALKIERIEQDMHGTNKYGMVYFKKEFNEVDFNTSNITETFFDNLIPPPDWKPIAIWVKKDHTNTIITEWRDHHGHTQFQQLSAFMDFFREWQGDPTDNVSAARRVQRAVTTHAPDFTNVISPLSYGYELLASHQDYLRKLSIKELIKEGNKLPDPPHFAEIACRKMMKNLLRMLPPAFLEGKFPAAKHFIEKFAHWETVAIVSPGFKKFSTAVEQFHEMFPDEGLFYFSAKKIINDLEELDKKIKIFHYRNEAWRDQLTAHHTKYIAREMKVNNRINSIIDRISYPGLEGGGRYILKTRTRQELENQYPVLFNKLKINIKELHSQAEMIRDLFIKKTHPKMIENVLLEFTGKKFTPDEVNSFTFDFKRLQNNILRITPEKFRIFEERYSRSGKLVSGCFKHDAEKLLYSAGDVAFTTADDNHKHIYLQNVLNDDLFKQIAIHEIDHFNNGLNAVYTHPEVYIESYNLMRKFTFRGVEKYGKELLSDRNHLTDYLMHDNEFLQSFCIQLMQHAKNTLHKNTIEQFERNYLSEHSPHFSNRYSEEAEPKRKDLKVLIDIAYNDHQFLLYFIKHNADFMTSFWHRVAEMAAGASGATPETDKDVPLQFDLIKSLALKVSAALFHEPDVGTSGSSAGTSGTG